MFEFNRSSLDCLATVNPDLQKVLMELAIHEEFRVICGHRGEMEQNQLHQAGKSKLPWPVSRHNSLPSLAVDLVPFGVRETINWNDLGRFIFFAGQVVLMGKLLGIPIRSGCDWNMDRRHTDERFRDLGHFELIGESP
jgi:peptidoglycan L-alanyl-D-glutamate endopeptidase CwlK